MDKKLDSGSSQVDVIVLLVVGHSTLKEKMARNQFVDDLTDVDYCDGSAVPCPGDAV